MRIHPTLHPTLILFRHISINLLLLYDIDVGMYVCRIYNWYKNRFAK